MDYNAVQAAAQAWGAATVAVPFAACPLVSFLVPPLEALGLSRSTVMNRTGSTNIEIRSKKRVIRKDSAEDSTTRNVCKSSFWV